MDKEVGSGPPKLIRKANQKQVCVFIAELVIDTFETVDFNECNPKPFTGIDLVLDPCCEGLIVGETSKLVPALLIRQSSLHRTAEVFQGLVNG